MDFIFGKNIQLCYIKSNVMHIAERLHLLIKLPPILGSLGFDSAANEMTWDAQAKATSFIFNRDHQLAHTIISKF